MRPEASAVYLPRMQLREPEFTVLGFPVRLEFSFFLVSGLLALGRPVAFIISWIGVVLVSILVHELGHAVAFRFFGQRATIRLYAFGGLTYGSSSTLNRGERIAVSLAGPLAAMAVLGVPAMIVQRDMVLTSWTAVVIVSDLKWVNIGWSIFNLLPLLPLDGGHVAEEILQARYGVTRGWRHARVLSIATALVAAVWAYQAGLGYGVMLVLFLGLMSLSQLMDPTGASRAPWD